MVEIGHTFRAGWDACEKAFQEAGIPWSATETELQAAWDAYCSTSTPAQQAPLTKDVCSACGVDWYSNDGKCYCCRSGFEQATVIREI